jgi:hypothetical protein
MCRNLVVLVGFAEVSVPVSFYPQCHTPSGSSCQTACSWVLLMFVVPVEAAVVATDQPLQQCDLSVPDDFCSVTLADLGQHVAAVACCDFGDGVLVSQCSDLAGFQIKFCPRTAPTP